MKGEGVRWGERGGRRGAAAGATGEVSESELLFQVFEERHFGRLLIVMMMLLLMLLYFNNLKRRHERGAPLLPSQPPWLAYQRPSPFSFSSDSN